MASGKRSHRTTVESPPPPILLDPLLEILARSDVAAVVNCAATSKPTRSDVLGEDFRRRLALRAEANGGFDPALLLGFSYRFKGKATAPGRVAQTCQQHLRFDADLLKSFDAVASRDGLVLLLRQSSDAIQRRRGSLSPAPRELRVCNRLTGQTSILPPADVRDRYPHALLTVGDAGRSFQLLAADKNLRTQTFSSVDGRWGAVVETHFASRLKYPYNAPDYASRAMVLGATVHWLCLLWCHNRDPYIISLDTGAAQATRVDLPPECIDRMRFNQTIRGGLVLAASPADRRLSVLAVENRVISMWTLSVASEEAAPRWTRQVMIRRLAIGHEPGPGYSVHIMGFGERSGAMILQMDGIGLVQVNLGSKETLVLSRSPWSQQNYRPGPLGLCMHEIDLPALLQATILNSSDQVTMSFILLSCIRH